jgi:hypothetical protein
MVGKKRDDLPAGLARARHRFVAWRETRKPGARIPQRLWTLAVEQAKTHGICKTASVLGLDYYSFKKRVEAGAAPPAESCGFVEVSPSAIAAGGEYVIELEDAAGASMRVHLKGCPAPDLVALTRSFWNGE